MARVHITRETSINIQWPHLQMLILKLALNNLQLLVSGDNVASFRHYSGFDDMYSYQSGLGMRMGQPRGVAAPHNDIFGGKYGARSLRERVCNPSICIFLLDCHKIVVQKPQGAPTIIVALFYLLVVLRYLVWTLNTSLCHMIG